MNKKEQLVDSIIDESKGQIQLPRESVVKQILDLLAKIRLTDEEAEALAKVISSRCRSFTCSACGQVKARVGSVLTGGQRICESCHTTELSSQLDGGSGIIQIP